MTWNGNLTGHGAVTDTTAAAITRTLTATDGFPKGKLIPIADLTQTTGLNLEGITRTVLHLPNARLLYRDHTLYLSRITGTLVIMR